MRKSKISKSVLSFFMVLFMVFAGLPVNAGATETKSADTISFSDIAQEDIKGYVKISFIDYGVRMEEGIEEAYRTPLGDIVKQTNVPFAEGETIPQVTLRLLEALDMDCEYGGSIEDGFYIKSIKNFTKNDVIYDSFGEYDAGSQSGWMMTYNNWFTSQAASAYTVEDGDVIKWQYSCQWGADIGNDYSKASAEITGIDFGEDTGIISPAFDAETVDYIYTVDETTENIGLEILLENYSSVVTCTVDGDTVKYKPMGEIPIKDGSVIKVQSTYTGWGTDPVTDEITITIHLSNSGEIADIYKVAGDYLENVSKTTAPTVSSTGGEWLVLSLARSGRTVPEGYYTNVEDYVKANINEAGQLHRSKSTDNSRVILALTAAGYNVTDVAGYNLLKGLSDMEYLKKQGINGPVWALIALDSHGYETSQTALREAILEYIFNARLEDGGFAISGTVADPDMTAIVITALAPYYTTNAKVKTVVDDALTVLSAMQKEDGGYTPAGSAETTCESAAQVVTALTALGINPDTDARFIKNGNSVLKALSTFAVEEGGFKHTLSGSRDGMATEQGYYALVSYVRMTEGKSSLYDMADISIREKNPTQDSPAQEPAPQDPPTQNPPTQNPPKPSEDENSQTITVTEEQQIKSETIFTKDGNKYKVTGTKTVSFTGLKSSSTKKVIIPKTVTYKGTTYKVSAIAEKALKGKTKVVSVTVGANVKTIGAYAFKDCKKLSKVTIGSGVTTIGKEAFRNCKTLSKVSIESKVLKKIGKNAFKNIKTDASVKVPEKKLSAYKKLLKDSGLSKKASIKK